MENNVSTKTYSKMRAEFYKTYKTQIEPILIENEQKHVVKKIRPHDVFVCALISFFVYLVILSVNLLNSDATLFTTSVKNWELIRDFFLNILTPAISTDLIFIFFMIFGMILFFKIAMLDTDNKELSAKIKVQIMNKITSIIGDITWTPNGKINIHETNTLGLFEFNEAYTDDCFLGVYNGVDFKIYNSRLEHKEYNQSGGYTVFDGVIIKIKLNKKFKGHTVCYAHSEFTRRYPKHLHETIFEDMKFEKNFDVWTTDDIEARYLITTSFIDRLNNIEKKFLAKNIECVFRNGYLYILFEKNNAFDICDISKPLVDFKQFNSLFEQILAIYQLIDTLKLELKIGM